MNKQEYWQEALACALEENEVSINFEKIKKIAERLADAHEMYGFYSGNEVASRNRNEDMRKEMMREGENKIISLVEDLVLQADGSNRSFDEMTHDQRLSFSKIFNLRDYVKRKKI